VIVAERLRARARAAAPPARSRRPPLREGARTPLWERAVERTIAVLAFSAIAAILLIFVFIGREAAPLLWDRAARDEASLSNLFTAEAWDGYEEPVYVWQPVGRPPKYNVVPLFVGTLKVTILAMLCSVPLGIGCAIFLSEYASRRFREIVKPIIELLAAVPSVVLGLFALMTLADWVQSALGLTYRLNATVAALALAFTTVPMIFTIAEDALQAVPRPLREASIALGARKWQTTLKVVLPAALPGIAAAVVLGFGRAIGETMIVLMASGNASVVAPLDPVSSVRTVTATIAAELGEVARGTAHWRVLFALGVMLFLVTFFLNLGGRYAVRRLQRRLTAS
jgi:phosphate transport system permease protein